MNLTLQSKKKKTVVMVNWFDLKYTSKFPSILLVLQSQNRTLTDSSGHDSSNIALTDSSRASDVLDSD